MSSERPEVTGSAARETEAAAGSGIDASGEEPASPATASEDAQDGENGEDGGDGEQGRELLDLAAPMWSAGHTARQLGLTPAELLAATAAGRILGVSPADSNRKSYPVAQFERTSEGVIRVKSRLQGFITTLLAEGSRDPWTCVICLNLASPELDGMTPLQWARARKDPETLTAFGRLLNAEFYRR